MWNPQGRGFGCEFPMQFLFFSAPASLCVPDSTCQQAGLSVIRNSVEDLDARVLHGSRSRVSDTRVACHRCGRIMTHLHAWSCVPVALLVLMESQRLTFTLCCGRFSLRLSAGRQIVSRCARVFMAVCALGESWIRDHFLKTGDHQHARASSLTCAGTTPRSYQPEPECRNESPTTSPAQPKPDAWSVSAAGRYVTTNIVSGSRTL